MAIQWDFLRGISHWVNGDFLKRRLFLRFYKLHWMNQQFLAIYLGFMVLQRGDI